MSTNSDVLADWIDDSKLLELPPISYSPEREAEFARLLDSVRDHAQLEPLDYRLAEPKYEFLCWVADQRGLLLHGSNDPGIQRFEPRYQTDAIGRVLERVYATPDGVWPMYFAILDRARYQGSLRNRFVRRTDPDGTVRRLYRFSINRALLDDPPWTTGTIYLLPRDTFQPTIDGSGEETEEWASPVPVSPLAKITVEPADFPFLDRLEGHDDSFATRLGELQMLLITNVTGIRHDDDHTELLFAAGPEVADGLSELIPLLRQAGLLGTATAQLDSTHDGIVLHLGPGAGELLRAIKQAVRQVRGEDLA